MDSVDQLQHLQGTHIQWDTERTRELDVMAAAAEHGQEISFFFYVFIYLFISHLQQVLVISCNV